MPVQRTSRNSTSFPHAPRSPTSIELVSTPFSAEEGTSAAKAAGQQIGQVEARAHATCCQTMSNPNRALTRGAASTASTAAQLRSHRCKRLLYGF